VTANILPEQRVDRKMQQNLGDYVYAPTPALIRKEASHGLYTFVNRWQMGGVGTTLNHVGTTLQEPPEIEDSYTRNASLCFPECFC
jgi:hypothetical protein